MYTTDNRCYQPKSTLLNKTNLDDYFDISFIITNNTWNENKVQDCKSKAMLQNKSFFMTTDVSNNINGNLTYKCLIPKTNKLYTNNSIHNIFQPFDNFINDLFGNSNGQRITNQLTISGSNINTISDLSDCFYINENNNRQNFSKSGNFIIYKTELLKNKNLRTSLNQIKPYEEYNNIYNTWISNKSNILIDLSKNINAYICTPPSQTPQQKTNVDLTFKSKIKEFNDYIDRCISTINKLITDISNLVILTNYDTLYLENLQKIINEKKIQNNNLINFDGANNGKLSDTKFLKNLKISENIILFLIIIFVIFAFTKKKL